VTVTLYTGHVGSGKSYEVVKSVILPALAKGRPVVSNIEGLNADLIRQHLVKGGTDQVGELTVVDRLDIRRPDFFPARQADGSYLPSVWVPLGALVVVDEAPFYWGSDKSILPAHLAFFREHRHITAADGTACDLVVVSQTVDAVHRSLKGLVEFSIDCRRLAALGLNRKYTTVTYEGAKRSGKYVMGRSTQSYDRRIFPLYASFSTANGQIVQTDKRFTIWSSKFFWAAVVVAPLAFVGAIYVLYHNFYGWHRSPEVAAIGAAVPAAASSAVTAATGIAPAAASAGGRAAAPGASPGALAVPHMDIGGESTGPVSVWRISGAATFGGRDWVVLHRTGFPLRYLPLSLCMLSMGRPVTCHVGTEVFEPESPQMPPLQNTAAAWSSATAPTR
jgi:zona occludens toxin